MTKLTNEDLLRHLRSDEDNFIERKTINDKSGWLKTVVAFANSAPLGWPGILFIGVTNKGDFAADAQHTDLDKLQREKLAPELKRAFPPIYYLTKIVRSEDGKQCLAVLVPGSGDRPHFSGKSYVRNGSETKEASGEQFERLIASRNTKVREILKWKEKKVTLQIFKRLSSQSTYSPVTVVECNQFFVTLRPEPAGSTFRVEDMTLPLSTVELGMDARYERLLLEHRE